MFKVKVASGNSPGEEMTGKLKQASDIFFCEKGGNLTCCFSNVQCLEDWHELNDKVSKTCPFLANNQENQNRKLI